MGTCHQYLVLILFSFSWHNQDSKFVEGRRKKLQHYIRCVLNFCVSNTAELADNPCKEVLLGILPFFM